MPHGISQANEVRIDEVRELVRQISPLLHGHSAVVVGAVLAELTGIWFAGHRSANAEEQEGIFAILADHHMGTVLRLAGINDRAFRQTGKFPEF